MAEMDLDLMLERLRETVGDRGPTQVAQEIDAPQSSVSMYLNGKRSPKVGFLKKIARTYNVNIEWLLGFPDAPKYPDFPEPTPDEDIVILARAAKNMNPEDRKKLLEMARLMFGDAFEEKR